MTIIGSSDLRGYFEEIRYLVCESQKCNPRLHDYDQLVERYAQFGGDRHARAYIRERAGTLNHTPHVTHEKFDKYDSRMGWIKSWKCLECGHVRKF